MEPIDRIFYRLKELGHDQKWLASQLGILPQTVTEWKKGKSLSYSRTDKLAQIAVVLETTVQWLMYGEELPQEKKASSPEGELAKLLQEPLMEEIYEAAKQLSPEARKIILAQIRAVKALESDANK